MNLKVVLRLLILFFILVPSTLLAQAAPYRYFRLGNKNDVAPHPSFGLAFMGGGSDLDEAFRWLCDKASGGDFLILRASGDDDYNPYVKKLCDATRRGLSPSKCRLNCTDLLP